MKTKQNMYEYNGNWKVKTPKQTGSSKITSHTKTFDRTSSNRQFADENLMKIRTNFYSRFHLSIPFAIHVKK